MKRQALAVVTKSGKMAQWCLVALISLSTALLYLLADLKPGDHLKLTSYYSKDHEMPVILFWNSLYDPKSSRALPAEFSSDYLNCTADYLPLGQKCAFTHNRKKLPDADVVIIPYRQWDRHLPSYYQRQSWQIWTFHMWESPAHTYSWNWVKNLKTYKQLAEMKGVFNWTMTYRQDSIVPYSYGQIRRRKRPDFSRKYDRLANKTRTAIWMASNCDTMSHREDYIRKLEKAGVDVEIIGKCDGKSSILSDYTGKPCDRNKFYSTTSECTKLIGSIYKFYLAFENSLCRDYVTEKFFRAASADIIPVVMNGANMSAIAPPHSYIDAKDFKSPGELADYLNKVGSNAELYNSYFSWKPYYDVEETFDGMAYTKNVCRFCSIVHRHLAAADSKTTIYNDIEDWWIKQGECYEGSAK